MKLRIRGNSIRLRLTKSEVAQFGETGKVEEIVEFGGAEPGLGYRLYTTTDNETMRAKFENNCLYIAVPLRDAENWINSGQVGIETEQPLGDDKSLRILVEKDFACLEPQQGEDDMDPFPPPLEGKIC